MIHSKGKDDMNTPWEAWLAAHPEFSLTGRDDDGDIEIDSDDEDSVAGSAGADDSEDDGADDDDDDADTARRIRNLEKDNRRLSRELEAAVELLNEKADKERSSDDSTPPEGFVAQEDYDLLLELLRTDYVENAIDSFKNKDGSAKWEWEDRSAVYKFLDIDELEIDVKSKVIDGLEDQLADIAERYPFMLKGKGSAKQGPGKTGTKPGKPGTREKKQDPSTEALVAEFPALVD